MPRQLNEAGLKILKESEGCRLKAYPDPGTKDDPIKKGEPWTIGWGATGPGIREGLIWTQAQADARLASDLHTRCLAVENFTKGVPLTDNQFSALVCFAYNVGIWRSSTLFKHVLKGEYSGAADEFSKWVHTNGHIEQGLVTRRQRERTLFLS